jgi:hypothetical protein
VGTPTVAVATTALVPTPDAGAVTAPTPWMFMTAFPAGPGPQVADPMPGDMASIQTFDRQTSFWPALGSLSCVPA